MMQLFLKVLRSLKFVVVFLGVITLGACKSHYQPLSATHGTNGEPEETTKSYVLNGQPAYQRNGGRDQDGRIINPLIAPANQTYYFDFDQDGVNSADYRAIAIQAKYLVTHPHAKVRLEGHTDNRGSREYNIGLGWRRDQAVARLLEQEGVLSTQIDKVSYGKEKPAMVGEGEAVWKLNRRVHLVYENY